MFSSYRIFSTLVFTFLLTKLYARYSTNNVSPTTAWNLGSGFAQNSSQLIAFRFLSGIGGSAPLAVRILSTVITFLIKMVDPFPIDWWWCTR